MFTFCINTIKLSMKEFWELTPREGLLLLNDYIKNKEQEEKDKMADRVILAWYTANYSNAKKLPNLQNEIKNIYKTKENVKSNKKMSKEEMERHYRKKGVR